MYLLEAVKRRLNVTVSYEDEKILDIIEEGQVFIEDRVGACDWEYDKSAIRLLKEYCRFAWNGSVAYYEDSFRSDILNLQLKKAIERRCQINEI